MTHAGNKTTLLAYDFEARELVIADPLPFRMGIAPSCTKSPARTRAKRLLGA